MIDLQSLVKYVLEGLVVGLAIFLVSGKNIDFRALVIVALTAAATFAVLDQFSPFVALGARQGSGFMIGFHQVGMGQSDEMSDENICQMVDGRCTYNPDISQNKLEKFICKQKDDKCVPVSACKRKVEIKCELNEDIKDSEELGSRACVLQGEDENGTCILEQKSKIEGFSGFRQLL